MQARLFKSPLKEVSQVTNALNDFSGKKNSQYFLTRLKGVLIKQCSSRDYKCSYKEFKIALKTLKIIFIDEQNYRELRNIFLQNDDQLRINDIIQSIQYDGQNISCESMIRINTNELKYLTQNEQKTQISFVNSKFLKTEGDDILNKSDIISRRQKTPQSIQQNQNLMNRSFISTNRNIINNLSPNVSQFPQQNLQQSSTFNIDSENIEAYKKIRLPRPKNVRNEINLRPFTSKDQFNITTTGDKKEISIVDKLKLQNIDYHQLLILEKILNEFDPDNMGIAEKEKYINVVKKHIPKLMTDNIIEDIIEYISNGNYISSTKLSTFLDTYKYIARFPTHLNKNDSNNYKKKMMDHDITIQKISNVQELYILLIEKLEEKFDKFLKAFKYFDVQHDGQIYYPEFKSTIDKLCLRFREDEMKELFNFLDKKQDGYIDYEEFCSLVPNKLELEMLENNGENLFTKTNKIYEKFGDVQNYCQDPYRVIERSRFQSSKFLDETTNKIGKDIFYSDKLKKIIENNIVVRKGRCDPGISLKHGYNIPSQTNTNFTYGIKSKNTENMFDIINNNYGQEWVCDLEQKKHEKEMMLTMLKHKKQNKNTYTNLLRQLHNTQCFGEESRSLPRVKKLAEQNQIKPLFEKTFSDLKKRTNSTLLEHNNNNSNTQGNEYSQSNIGQIMRQLNIPNSTVNNKQEIILPNSKTETTPIRSKSTFKNISNAFQRNQQSPQQIQNLNKTFNCQI